MMPAVNPAHLARLERALAIAAECVAMNETLIPVFERIEAELAEAQTALISDPVARARRMVAQRQAARA